MELQRKRNAFTKWFWRKWQLAFVFHKVEIALKICRRTEECLVSGNTFGWMFESLKHYDNVKTIVPEWQMWFSLVNVWQIFNCFCPRIGNLEKPIMWAIAPPAATHCHSLFVALWPSDEVALRRGKSQTEILPMILCFVNQRSCCCNKSTICLEFPIF